MVPVDFSHRRDAQPRSEDHRGVRRRILSPSIARACAHAKDTAMRAVPAPFDVVLTTNSGYPLDQNLYQAVKGMSAAAKIVKPGGTIVCAAECRDGLPVHGSYGAGARARSRIPRALLAMINAPRLLGARSVAGAGPGADSDEGAACWSRPAASSPTRCAPRTSSRSTTWPTRSATRLSRAGPDATLCVLPQGPQTIPYVASTRRGRPQVGRHNVEADLQIDR